MGGTVRAEAGGIQGTPLTAGAEPAAEGLQGLPISDAPPLAPQGVRLARGEQRLDTFPSRVRDTPITVGLLMLIRHV